MAVAIAAAFSFGAVGAAQAATDLGTGKTSKDWSGYVLKAGTGQSFDKAGASWTQPAGVGTCSPATMGIVAFAVGFDGVDNGPTSEQGGTAIQCSPTSHAPGAPFAYQHIAFWEIDPGHPNFVPPPVFPVSAGDKVTVTVTYAAPNTFTFKFENHTTKKTYSASGTGAGARTSVMAIAENPTGGAAPLANFGKVTFRDPDVHLVSSGDEEGNHDGEHQNNDGEHHGQFVAITMQKSDGTVQAVPSFPFSVTWKHA